MPKKKQELVKPTYTWRGGKNQPVKDPKSLKLGTQNPPVGNQRGKRKRKASGGKRGHPLKIVKKKSGLTCRGFEELPNTETMR